MSYEISGTLKVINEVQTFGSGFTKREFVVTTQEQYPQDIKLELVKDKTSLLDRLRVNDKVTVKFNIRGNEYQGKYFVNLQAWAIDKTKDVAPDDYQPSTPAPEFKGQMDENMEDDLPF